MNQQENNGFQYTYSAKEQEELKKIRERYATQTEQPEESKMDRLRRLDRGATKKAQSVTLPMGIVGTLILGFGMSMIMTDLFALPPTMALIVGSAVGTIGGILVGMAYPIYQRILKHERKKIAPEILKLTDELMK